MVVIAVREPIGDTRGVIHTNGMIPVDTDLEMNSVVDERKSLRRIGISSVTDEIFFIDQTD